MDNVRFTLMNNILQGTGILQKLKQLEKRDYISNSVNASKY